jgi:hypothetical protein
MTPTIEVVLVGREVDLSDTGALTRTDEQLQDEAGEST